MGIPEPKISNQELGAPLKGQLGDWASNKLRWELGALLRSSSEVRTNLAVCVSCSWKFGLCSCRFGWGQARAAGAFSRGLLYSAQGTRGQGCLSS